MFAIEQYIEVLVKIFSFLVTCRHALNVRFYHSHISMKAVDIYPPCLRYLNCAHCYTVLVVPAAQATPFNVHSHQTEYVYTGMCSRFPINFSMQRKDPGSRNNHDCVKCEQRLMSTSNSRLGDDTLEFVDLPLCSAEGTKLEMDVS